MKRKKQARKSRFKSRILWALKAKEGPCCGKELYSDIRRASKQEAPRAESTVYRVLQELAEEGLVKKVGTERVRGTFKDLWIITPKGKEWAKSLYREFRLKNQFLMDIITGPVLCKECDPSNPLCFKSLDQCWENAIALIEEAFQNSYGLKVELGREDVEWIKTRAEYPINLVKLEQLILLIEELDNIKEEVHDEVWGYLQEKFLPPFNPKVLLEIIRKKPMIFEEIIKYYQEKFHLQPFRGPLYAMLEGLRYSGTIVYGNDEKYYDTANYLFEHELDPAEDVLEELKDKRLTFEDLQKHLYEKHEFPIPGFYLKGILEGLLTAKAIEEKDGRFTRT